MNKLEVQQRVLQNGKPLDLDKFEWDEKAKVFSTVENNLVLDFTTGSDCTFKTGFGCTFTTGHRCTFTTGSGCTFKTGFGCTFKTGFGCTFTTGHRCTFTTGSGCTFTTGFGCTFKTGFGCTFTTGHRCTFTTGSGCTFTTGSGCTFTTGSDCTFKTWYGCTFTTRSGCTFTTGSDCTFATGSGCVIVNNNIFEVIQPKEGQVIQICPCDIAGHLVDGKLNGVPHIIADGILSRVISQKGNIYKVINHGQTKQSYLIKEGNIYSHGKTLKEATDSLIYKIGSRDTAAYKDLTLDSVLTKEECIKAYRAITGACEEGTKYFVNNQKEVKKSYSIKEIVEATKEQFGNDNFKKFFKSSID